MQLYGYRPAEGEADPRPTPEDQAIQTAVSDIFDALISTIADTSLDFDLDEILWSTAKTFHRAAERIERKLDDNEQAQKRLQREQDGSEFKSVQLESLELFRETAADFFLRVTGTRVRAPRTNHRHLTAAMIDSRDFLAAQKIAETEMLVPPGPKFAFSGGDNTDHRTIWDRLDQIYAKHPDMVLMHGGERTAATWASNHGPLVAVGLPRLLMGSLLLVAVLLAIGREIVATHRCGCSCRQPLSWWRPSWYPLAPTAAILAWSASSTWCGWLT